MSPLEGSRSKSRDSVTLAQDACCERKSEVSLNAAIVLQRTAGVVKKGDSSARRKYSVTVRGEIPLNLVERVSSLHASALQQTRQPDLAAPTTSQRRASKVTNKRERSVHVQPKNDSNL
jgi:hypothetical protein